ncbi:MAG: cupredoxin domain-containing protein [Actinomycetota bacterium]|nr:cupredoxin domain-containing protein [Actinomycetota bacterium]
MNKYVRDRILIPVGIPIAVLVGVGFVIVNISRVLLAVNKDLSVVIAIAVATSILLGAAFAASPKRPRRARTGLGLLVVLAVVVGTSGAIAAQHGEREVEKHAKEPAPLSTATPTITADVTVTIVAKLTKFDKAHLDFPSAKTIDVKMTNEDATIHNWALFRDAAMSDVVFRGDTFSGPGSTKDYIFTAPPPGTYHFHCDVHPVMEGTVTVG